MIDLSWLKNHRFCSLDYREFDWVFTFERDVRLATECLWRAVVDGHIHMTSKDHGHQFGLPAPIDAAVWINDRLSGRSIERATVREGTLDLEIRFETGDLIQVLPDSSGYEAWSLQTSNSQFIATGGGKLVEFSENVDK